MAIAVMTRIWNKAEQKGSQLLLLLAMADVATEESLCWPGTEYLAKRIRMSERQTQRMLDSLIAEGAIICMPGGGRKHFDHYALLVGLSESEQAKAVKDLEKKVNMSPLPEKTPYTKGDKMSPIGRKQGRQDVTHIKGDISERVTFSHRKGDISHQERVTFSEADDQPNTRMATPQTGDSPKGDPVVDPNHDPVVVVVVDQQHADATGSNTNENVNQNEPPPTLVGYLKQQGMSATAAKRFAKIPYAIGRAAFDAERAAGTPISHIVNNWREHPPTTEEHYEHRPDSGDYGIDGPGLRNSSADRRTAGPRGDRERELGADRTGGSDAVEECSTHGGTSPSSGTTAPVQTPGRAETSARTGRLTAAQLAAIAADAEAELREAQRRRC